MEGAGLVTINGQTYNSLRGPQGVTFSAVGVTGPGAAIPTVNCLTNGNELLCQKTGDTQIVHLYNCRTTGAAPNQQTVCQYQAGSITGSSSANWILWVILFILIIVAIVMATKYYKEHKGQIKQNVRQNTRSLAASAGFSPARSPTRSSASRSSTNRYTARRY